MARMIRETKRVDVLIRTEYGPGSCSRSDAYGCVEVSAPKVVEDARESPDPRRPRPGWGWLVVGLVLGAGLAVLVLRTEPDRLTTATTVAGGVGDPGQEGIADMVAGFPDGLALVTGTVGQSLELLTWPSGEGPIQESIPVGASRPPNQVLFDVSGRRIATLLPVPEESLGALVAGVPQNATIFATGVTGYAWHDSDLFRLAYTTLVDEELLLWTVRESRSEPELVVRAVGIVGRVAAWGDWGFAIQDEDRGSVILFTPDGEIKDTHPGRILDSDGNGWMAIDRPGLSLLSAGGGVRGLEREGLANDLLSGQFSDDRSRLAILTGDRVQVVDLGDDSVLIESDGRAGVPVLEWSSDGRFVLYPGTRGIWVVDTLTGNAEQLLTDGTFAGLGVLPSGES